MKNYFEHIAFKYDNETRRTLKEYCNEGKRLAQQEERLKFILTCRSYGIVPNHTKRTTTKVTKLLQCTKLKGKLRKIEHNFHKKILNLEISQTSTNITIIKRKLFHLRSGIKNMLLDEDYEQFCGKQINRVKQIKKNIDKRQNNKLDTLKENEFKSHGLVYNNNWFENKTKINIPLECKWMLSLGRKFAIPVNNHNFSALHVIADIEQSIQMLDDNYDNGKDVARTKLAHNIIKFKRKIVNTPKEKFILRIYENTKKFIRKNNDIIIIQSDKGNRTVAMYKSTYKEKMEKLLEDRNTYRTLRVDPTNKLHKENNNIITDLYKNGNIDIWQKRRLLCSAATAPRIYGLPKIHKPEIPLRPIVSSMQVPCYQLSKHVGQILRHIISDKYNIKNSIQLKKQLCNVDLNDNEILVSFDVISLFTNIPVQTAIKIIMNKWDTIKNHTKIARNKFLQILQFCLCDNNYFMYDKKFYNQVFGMPMGNPLSPTIADIVLDSLLDNAISILKNNDKHIKYIVKYVDDIFAIINYKDKDVILHTLNDYHPKIQFTMETETNNEIAYLDSKIIRRNNIIAFDWYVKEIASGRIINFNSTQPKNQILNTAKNFILRVLNISDKIFHNNNIKKIKKTLLENSFPIKLITSLINETSKKLEKQNITNHNIENNEKIFLSVNYIPGLTDNNNIKSAVQNKNVTYAYKPNMTLNTIFTNIKAPINKQQRSNVVYEIPCGGDSENSCDLLYIGTTKRALEIRIGEHKNDIARKKETTGLSQHICMSGHKPNFEKVKILDTERIEKKRYTIESLRIQQKIDRTMNHKEDVDNINNSYRVAI